MTQQIKSSTVTYLDKDRVIRILRRNDRFLSLLHNEDIALVEDDKVEAERIKPKAEVDYTAFWTQAKLADMMLQRLVSVQVIICGSVRSNSGVTKEGCYRVPKYSEDAAYIAAFAVFSEEARTLTIHLSDLGPEILGAFMKLDSNVQPGIIAGVGKRLFRLFYPHYFAQMGELIKVGVEV
ncbi:MAG: hypothetical protein WA941_23370 [Nitrososphaeraceae archaeon]